MSKVVDITGVSSKEARLKRIIASLEEIKDTLVDVIEAEDESSDKLDLLTEALDALEDANDALNDASDEA